MRLVRSDQQVGGAAPHLAERLEIGQAPGDLLDEVRDPLCRGDRSDDFVRPPVRHRRGPDEAQPQAGQPLRLRRPQSRHGRKSAATTAPDRGRKAPA